MWYHFRRLCGSLTDTHTQYEQEKQWKISKFVGYYNVNPRTNKKSGCWIFQLVHWLKENLSCLSTDINIKKHIKKDGWIRMWMLQVSSPSCDRSVFSTELICMNCDASVSEVTSCGLDDKGSVSSGSRDLSLCHYIQTGHGSHSSSYPMVRYHGFLSLE